MLILSVGENCLPGMVLKRFGIENTWSTPYTYARSNIEQCLRWEKEEYQDFLNDKYICRIQDSLFPELYRNVKYLSHNNEKLYDKSVDYGIEFTHHDVITNAQHRESYRRKIARMKRLKNTNEDILFIYYHRYTNDSYEQIIDLCKVFVNYYSCSKRKCNIAIIVQKLVDAEQRGVKCTSDANAHLVEFYTTEIWRGDGMGVISGEVDDDLFIEFFRIMYKKKLISDIGFLDKYIISPFFYLRDEKYSDLLKDYLQLARKEHFYLWGNGSLGKKFLKYLSKHNIFVDGIIDKNANEKNYVEKEVPIMPFESIKESAMILITINDESVASEIIKFVNEKNKDILIKSFYEIVN